MWIDCNGKVPVSAATKQNFTPSANGRYAVIVSKNGCSDTSSCHGITGVGLGSSENTMVVTVYPNPSFGNLTIETTGEFEFIKLTISNPEGQILQFRTYEHTDRIFLPLNYPAGVYFLTLFSNGFNSGYRIVLLTH